MTKHGGKRRKAKQYQRQKRKQVTSDVKAAVASVEAEPFHVTSIELTNKETGDITTVDEHAKAITSKSNMSAESDIVGKTLYVKERFNISNEAYHELSMVNKDLPRSIKLQKKKDELNSHDNIFPTPGNPNGVQQSLKERLHRCICGLRNKRNLFSHNGTVRVKITGDGTQISRNLHTVVAAFTIVEEGANPASSSGNHALAIVNVQEKYHELSEALSDIRSEVESLKTITVNEDEYQIEYFLGADWKFLAMCTGIEAANAKYSCVWCKCPSHRRHDLSTSWSCCDPMKGAWIIEEIQHLAALPAKRGVNKYGCVRQPLFPTIPVDHVIPDILHLFLRISDVLINLLILELRRLDGIDKSKMQTLDRRKATNVATYEWFLNIKCKISFHWFVGKETNTLQWRDLTGPEKIKVFEEINIPELFPAVPQALNVQQLWSNFFQIYNVLRSSNSLSKQEIDSFEVQVQNWIKDFLSIYQSKNVTPYMHLLVCHIPEFLRKYGTLASFTQQGLEKLNDDLTKNFFRSTNHRDKDALKQMLHKLNRLEELRDSGCCRSKTVHVCSVCNNSGHNARTCQKNSTSVVKSPVALHHHQ